MKVAVVGASGRAGSEIVKEAARRGHSVTAVARDPAKIAPGAGISAVSGDASDAGSMARLLRGHDALISALKFDVPAATILAAVREAGVPRLLVTGGAASLKNDRGERLIDSADFPESWKPIAMGGVDFLNALKKETEIDWVFFSPAFYFVEGPRTERFRLGKDDLVSDDTGDSRISFADYAIAMIDELEQPRHHRERFTIGY